MSPHSPWQNINQISPKSYNCGYCGRHVASNAGFFHAGDASKRIYICSFCEKPTYFDFDSQTPGVAFGNPLDHLPEKVRILYEEARKDASIGSFNSVVMVCRTILMYISVEEGAPPNQTFLEYVNFLDTKGFLPPKGKAWVDKIRKVGNDANHEIVLMTAEQAKELITFVEMLLKFIYEFPQKMVAATP